MQINGKIIGFIVFAAAVTALLAYGLWASVLSLSPLLFLFAVCVNLPVLITAYRFNIAAGVFSALIATVLLSLATPGTAAFLIGVYFFIPGLFGCWLMGFFQSYAPDGRVIWHPLSSILFQIALVVSAATIVVMLFIYDSAEATQFLRDIAGNLVALLREANIYSASDMAILDFTIRTRYLLIMVVTLAGYGVLFQLANLYVAARLGEHFHILHRPRDFWPTAVRMPGLALFVFGFSWLLAALNVNPTLNICLDIIVSALGAAFFICGLAFIHSVTLGRSWRTVALTITYILLFSFVLTALMLPALIITGLFVSARELSSKNTRS